MPRFNRILALIAHSHSIERGPRPRKSWGSLIPSLVVFLGMFPAGSSAQLSQLGSDIGGEAAGDMSGLSVVFSSDGSHVAVGGPFNDGNGVDSGHVRLFEWNDSTWVQLGPGLFGEMPGDRSGTSVALSSDGFRAAVGAPSNDGNGASSGHVRVFLLVLFADGFESGDTSAWSVVAP